MSDKKAELHLSAEEHEALEAQADEERRLLRAQEVDDMKWLMGHKQGRRIMWRVLAQAGVYRTSFTPNALTMAFNEGQRHVGSHWLGELMNTCPEQFNVMNTEQDANAKRISRTGNNPSSR